MATRDAGGEWRFGAVVVLCVVLLAADGDLPMSELTTVRGALHRKDEPRPGPVAINEDAGSGRCDGDESGGDADSAYSYARSDGSVPGITVDGWPSFCVDNLRVLVGLHSHQVGGPPGMSTGISAVNPRPA